MSCEAPRKFFSFSVKMHENYRFFLSMLYKKVKFFLYEPKKLSELQKTLVQATLFYWILKSSFDLILFWYAVEWSHYNFKHIIDHENKILFWTRIATFLATSAIFRRTFVAGKSAIWWHVFTILKKFNKLFNCFHLVRKKLLDGPQ